MAIWTPQHTPSYQQGFARCAAEAENPGLWDGLDGLWAPSLGPTGLTLRDWSGYGNHGTLTNMDPATDYVPSPYGWALMCENATEHVSFSDIIFPAQFSASVWCAATGWGAGYPEIAGATAELTTTLRLYSAASPGKLMLRNRVNGNDVTGVTDIASDGTWHHIVIVRDKSDNATIYLDGKFEATDTVTGDTTFNALFRGQYSHAAGRYWQGPAALLGFWFRTLVASEIQHLYRDPHALTRLRSRVYPAAAAPAAGHPTMRRWGGIPHMGSEPVLAGRSW